MDIFDVEIVKFWRSLQQNGVKFIMIGGFATNLHGYQRFTGDMDIWIEDTPENRKNLRKAFFDYGLGDLELLETISFIAGWTNFHLKNGLQLDIVTEMKGLEKYSFEECYDLAAIAEIDDVQIPFLHINHLILNKKEVGREKNLLDVIYLERIKKLEENNNYNKS
jgi:predicted nucleotidyltransferase